MVKFVGIQKLLNKVAMKNAFYGIFVNCGSLLKVNKIT